MQSHEIKGSFADARRLLDELVEGAKIPGASLLVLRGGEELFFHASGWLDVDRAAPLRRDTLFRIYSMTKPIIAAGVMALVDDGVLTLETDISDFVPEFQMLEVGADRRTASPISVRALLTHTAGLTYWFQEREPVARLYAEELGAGAEELWRFDPTYGGLDGLARKLAGLPLVDQPGDRWHYSMSLDIAGLLIERASGRKLDAFLRERLFDPLGMRDTGFVVPANEAGRLASLYAPRSGGGIRLLESGVTSPLLGPVPGLSGGGGLVSSIDDYACFAEMMRLNGSAGIQRILSSASVSAMMTNQLTPEQLAELPALAIFGLGGSGEGFGFGLGGAVIETGQTSATAKRGEYCWGGAASTTFWVDPANDISVVFMTQLTPPGKEMIRDRLRSALYRSSNPSEADRGFIRPDA